MIAANVKRVLRATPALRAVTATAEATWNRCLPRQIHVRDGSPTCFLASFVRVKNEGRFLPEWISYHVAQGVEHFYIYDNGSEDGTADILHPFIAAGYVTLIPWPQRPVYPSADAHFFRTFGHRAEWVMVFDPDEFFIDPSGATLASRLREVTAGVPAVGVNWRYYGSSNHDALPPGFVMENFTRADAALDAHVKVVVRPREVRRLRNPHSMYYRAGRPARTLQGRRVHASFASPPPTLDHPWLAHFVYRSREDYTRKATQGFADLKASNEVPRHVSRTEHEFSKHNQQRVPPPAVVTEQARSLARSLGFSSPYL